MSFYLTSVRSRILFYIIPTVMLSYILGYILPVGIDKANSLGDFYFSTYRLDFCQYPRHILGEKIEG